jgi:hypothetical protein
MKNKKTLIAIYYSMFDISFPIGKKNRLRITDELEGYIVSSRNYDTINYPFFYQKDDKSIKSIICWY